MSRYARSLFALALAVLFAVPAWPQEKTCPKCSKAYGAEAKFCLDDGTTLLTIEKCPKCRLLRQGKAKYCASCGYDFEKPKELTCAKCGSKAPPSTKFCVNCGASLPASGGAGTPGPDPGGAKPGGPEFSQWVESVSGASSQYGIRLFSKDQIVGPPNVERPGQDGRAWCPAMTKRGPEFIMVKFARPAIPKAIRVYETAAQGFVVRIESVTERGEVVIWEGADGTNAKAKILECIPGQGAPASDTYKVTIDTAKVRTGWTEIDAVELIGFPPSGGGGSTHHDDHDVDEHGGDVAYGPLGLKPGSELRYQITRGKATETLTVRVHHISEKSIGLAWTASGDRDTAGYVQVRQTALTKGAAYDDLFPAEQADTLEGGTVLWVSRHVHLELLEQEKSRIDIAGIGQVNVSNPSHVVQPVMINGRSQRLEVISAYIDGGGKVTILDDRSNPLVLDMERRGFRMTLQSAESVGGADPPEPKTGGGTTKPPDPKNTPPAETETASFATPDACFEAWKTAVSAADAAKLAPCYVSAERKPMEKDGDLAKEVFDRYRESIEKSKYSIESKKDVGSQTIWVVEVRVKELFWNRKAKDTFKFSKEGESWRLTIQKDGF